MRIPWYIYVPLCLIVPCVTLYIGVKDNDIVTPTLEETHDSVELWKAGYPISEETIQKVKSRTNGDGDAPEPDLEPNPAPSEPEKIEKPVAPPEPVIDISSIKLTETSPSLDSLTDQDLTAAQLIKYGENMIDIDQFQAARIAFERVIDMAKEATPENRTFAASKILFLSNLTPLWNPDPVSRKTLNVELSLNEHFKGESDRVVNQLKSIVLKASDGTVTANVKITYVKKETSDAPASTFAQSTLRISKDTPLVTFTVKEVTDLDAKIPAALYYAVRSKNNQIQSLVKIPERPTNISPLDALNSYITRLAWVNATIPVPSPTESEENSPSSGNHSE